MLLPVRPVTRSGLVFSQLLSSLAYVAVSAMQRAACRTPARVALLGARGTRAAQPRLATWGRQPAMPFAELGAQWLNEGGQHQAPLVQLDAALSPASLKLGSSMGSDMCQVLRWMVCAC